MKLLPNHPDRSAPPGPAVHLSGIVRIVLSDNRTVPLPPMLAWLCALVYAEGRDATRREFVLDRLWSEPGEGDRGRRRLNQLVHRINRLVDGVEVMTRQGDWIAPALSLASPLTEVPPRAPSAAAEQWAERVTQETRAQIGENDRKSSLATSVRDAAFQTLKPPYVVAPQIEWAVRHARRAMVTLEPLDWFAVSQLRHGEGRFVEALSLVRRAERGLAPRDRRRGGSTPVSIDVEIRCQGVVLETCTGSRSVDSAARRLRAAEQGALERGDEHLALRIRQRLIELLERFSRYRDVQRQVDTLRRYVSSRQLLGVRPEAIRCRYGNFLSHDVQPPQIRAVADVAGQVPEYGSWSLVEAALSAFARRGELDGETPLQLAALTAHANEAGEGTAILLRVSVLLAIWHRRIESIHAAERHIEQAGRVAEVSHDPTLRALAHSTRTEFHLSRGDVVEAERTARQASDDYDRAGRGLGNEPVARYIGDRVHALRGLVALEQGSLAKAEAYSALIGDDLSFHDPTLAVQLRARILARRQRAAEAVEFVTSAVDDLGSRFVPASVDLSVELGQLAQRTKTPACRARLTEAMSTARRCGMAAQATRLQGLIRHQGP